MFQLILLSPPCTPPRGCRGDYPPCNYQSIILFMSTNLHKSASGLDRKSPSPNDIESFLRDCFRFLAVCDSFLLSDYPWSFSSLHKRKLLAIRMALSLYLGRFLTASAYHRIFTVVSPSDGEKLHGYRLCPSDIRQSANSKGTRSKHE